MLTCVARLTGTFVAIDFVDAPAVVAGFALAVVQVDLTIETCGLGHVLSHTAEKNSNSTTQLWRCVKCLTSGAFWACADVGVLPVLASAAVLAGLAETLVDVGLTQAAGVAGTAVAGEGGQAILTGAVMAGIRVALIDISLTVLTRVP